MDKAYFNKYIGIPFKPRGRTLEGWDCWGLVYYVLLNDFKIEVPSYDASYKNLGDKAHLGTIVKTALNGEDLINWKKVTKGEEIPGDVVHLRVEGLPIHVGLVVKKDWMLHIEHGIDTYCERYSGLMWRNRIEGIYRYGI